MTTQSPLTHEHPVVENSASQTEESKMANKPNQEIVSTLYRTLVLLGADHDLLGTVGSWGNSLPEQDVLANLTAWNDMTAKELTQRIEHYEMSSHHPAYNRDEAERNDLQERKAS
jgi:hypothetical protein